MKVKYITVLDFEVGEVFQYEVNESDIAFDEGEYYEDFLIERGHNLNNIEWMVHNEPTVRRMYFTN